MEKLVGLKWSLKTGRFFIRPAADNTLALQNISGSVAMNGEVCSLTDARPAERTGADGKSEFLFANGVRWIWTAREKGNALELVSTLRNESGKPVEIGEWNVLHGRADRDGRIDLGPDPETVRFFRWKPWDMCVECFAADGNYHSTTLCHLYAPAAKRTALIAFVTLDRMQCEHRIRYEKQAGGIAEYRAVCTPGEYSLPPGGELRSETLRITYHSDPYEALESWADNVNERYSPSFEGTAGVCSCEGTWADSFTSRENDWSDVLLAETEATREKLGGFGISLTTGGTHCILKNGLPGNWLTFEKRRDGGSYRELLTRLHREGWNFKLWFSPFWFFGEADGILEENRENLLKDNSGAPVSRDFHCGWEFGRGPYATQKLTKYYLDGTHPKTKEYLKKIFAEYRKLGARAYMLDFLGMIPGARRYDETCLPLEAARDIFKAIRDAAGTDTHLQTAVASSPAFIGCVNSARVVRDYGEGRPMHPFPNWRNATYCMHDEHFSNAHSFVQNAAAAWFTNRKVYVNDLNEFTIDQPIPLEHARITATMFGLSGDSPMVLGDNLRKITPERLRMLKMCLPRTGGIPVPVDLFDSIGSAGGCHILKKVVTTTYDRYVLVAVFNTAPGADAYRTRIDFSKIGCDSNEKYRVFEFWNGEYVGTYRDSFPCAVPPGCCRLFRLSIARPYPWLLSTDMHIEQGNAEVETLAYDEKTRTLRGTVRRPAGESGRLVFLMPRHLKLVNHEEANTMKEVIDMQTVISLHVVFRSDKEDFRLEFECMDTDYVARPGWLPYATEAEWLAYVKANKDPSDTRVIE